MAYHALLSPEVLGNGLTIFISSDRSTFEAWIYSVLLGSRKTSDPALREAALQTLAQLQLVIDSSEPSTLDDPGQ